MLVRVLLQLLLLATAFLFSLYNVYDETRDDYGSAETTYLVRVAAAWELGPGIIFILYVLGPVLLRDAAPNFRLSAIILAIFSGLYAFYALNGPSDPLTAGHMHIILVPLFSAVLASPFMAIMLSRFRKLYRSSPRK